VLLTTYPLTSSYTHNGDDTLQRTIRVIAVRYSRITLPDINCLHANKVPSGSIRDNSPSWSTRQLLVLHINVSEVCRIRDFWS